MQISFFDGNNRFRIDKPIRLIELFAGIGAQAAALRNIGADFEHYRICELDSFAVTSYNAVHGTKFTRSNITRWTGADMGIADTDKYCYIVTWSFPCQALSMAGKRKGMDKGSGTTSSLGWEVIRLLKECAELPQVLVMENAPPVVTDPNFSGMQQELERLGYKNYYDILNAKNYGVPQNRERCFMVSALGDYYYEFPPRIKLKERLRDRLEPKVDEKYYLGEKARNYIANPTRLGKHTRIDAEIAMTLTAKGQQNWTGDFVGDRIIEAGDLNNKGWLRPMNVVIAPEGICPTLTSFGGGNTEQKIETVDKRIRKLTPRECWRLMGFSDRDFDKAKGAGISDSQLYKQAGNSIVVDVLEAIFKQML